MRLIVIINLLLLPFLLNGQIDFLDKKDIPNDLLVSSNSLGEMVDAGISEYWSELNTRLGSDEKLEIFDEEIKREAERRAHQRVLRVIRTPHYDNASVYGLFYEVYLDMMMEVLKANLSNKHNRSAFEDKYKEIRNRYDEKIKSLKQQLGVQVKSNLSNQALNPLLGYQE